MTIHPIRFVLPRRLSLAGALLVLVFALLFGVVGSASATRYYDSTIGTSSGTPSGTAYGATFGADNGGVGDIAVNDPSIVTDGITQSGWIYVVDRGNNRIQAFDQNKAFQWAIGRDVIAPTINEHQNLTVTATAGQFKLEFNGQTTADLNWNASANTVQTELRALSTIAGANVNVSGGPGSATGATPYVISFVGTLAAANQPSISVQAGTTALTGTAVVSTVVDGTAATPGDLGDVFEKCTVAVRCKAGSTGTAIDGPGGEFNVAQGLDIDQATGNLFINERTPNRRVQQFEANGAFVRAFGWDVVASGPGNTGGFETCNAAAGDVCQASGAAGNATGQFSDSSQTRTGIAVAPVGAPNAGRVYVADPGNARVQRFTVPVAPAAAVSAGEPFGTPGETGDGEFSNQTVFPGPFPKEIAADANGVVYATSQQGANNAYVNRFDTTTGLFLQRLAGGGLDNSGLGVGPTGGLEIDPATGHLLVGRPSALGIQEFDLTDKPVSIDPSLLVGSHIAGMGAELLAVGAGGAPGRYFASTSSTIAGTGTGNRILVLDDDGVEPDPDVTIEPATNVGATSATFNGNVNPILTAAFTTSYRWQLSKDGITWTDVAPAALVGGNGFTPQDVTATATGLEPNTLYRVRIATSRAPSAGVAFSSELVFTTDPAPPQVETRAAQQVSDVGAQLVGRLNPGGLASEYWFEWGDNDYGNVAPADPASASGGLDRLVAQQLSGLTPERVYHFRLCARNSLSPQAVCGSDRTFATLSTAAAPAQGRAYEMVLSPLKPLRRGGERGRAGFDYTRLEAGAPATGGGGFRSHLFAGGTDANSGQQFPRAYNHEIRRRQPGGLWTGAAVFNIPLLAPSANATSVLTGQSTDLDVTTWRLFPSIFATGSSEQASEASLLMTNDDGGPRGGGWYPWLDQEWFGGAVAGESGWSTSVDDTGTRLVAQGTDGDLWRNLRPLDDSLYPNQLTPPQTAGHAVFLSDRDHGWRPTDLVNECTGSGDSATAVPSRDDNGTLAGPPGTFSLDFTSYGPGSTAVTVFTFTGQSTSNVKVGHLVTGPGIQPGTHVTEVTDETTFQISLEPTSVGFFAGLSGGQDTAALADDTIGARPCEAGSPTDARGAILGSRQGERLGETAAAAMSEDGKRVFFLSPDPAVTEGQTACETGSTSTGAGTRCPAQLYVRQFDDNGNPTVRWLSRPEDALFEDGSGEPQQQPAALGTGVAFEGASRDGSVVYFRTDAPLLESDPNGGIDPLEGASSRSWDLYRYELGSDINADPAAGDPGDRLTRVSGGPLAAADPNTNCPLIATSGPDSGNCASTINSQNGESTSVNGAGSALRFVSDDGVRAYFVTAAQIPGVDNTPPGNSGTANIPTGVGNQVNASTRNIYLYDASQTGPDAYRFVARVPFSTAMSALTGCASAHGRAGGAPRLANMEGFSPNNSSAQILGLGVNCVHGSGSADAITFETTGQLTADDTDTGSDVYTYDATTDRLTRLSAPPAGSSAYPCMQVSHKVPASASCNGDLGFATTDDAPQTREPGLVGDRHWNIAQDAQGNLTDIYFETRLPLVDSDLNGPDANANGGMDVYRWRRADGRLSLVSPGNSDNSAFYAGNSLDGTDVFFWTEQRLSPWEVDDADGDVYNATTRTDLRPAPVSPPPTCAVLAGACQPGGGERTATPISTTGGGSDPGGPPARQGQVSLKGLSSKALRKATSSGVLAVRVKSTTAGMVRVSAEATLKGRVVAVSRGSHRFSRAGVATVKLRLNAKARRQLRQRGALALDVIASPSTGHATTLRVTLRRGGRR